MLALALLLVPVSGMTLTSYEVETPNGTAFVPFVTVHPRRRVEPLVTFG